MEKVLSALIKKNTVWGVGILQAKAEHLEAPPSRFFRHLPLQILFINGLFMLVIVEPFCPLASYFANCLIVILEIIESNIRKWFPKCTPWFWLNPSLCDTRILSTLYWCYNFREEYVRLDKTCSVKTTTLGYFVSACYFVLSLQEYKWFIYTIL